MITVIPVLIILLLSFAVYFNALFGDFVYDDTIQILENPWIRDIRNIPEIFSGSVWSFQRAPVISNYYRPLMHITYMLNYLMFGLAPWGFHLVNILFHCGASVLVFLIIRRLLTDHGVTTSQVYSSPPFIAALLFASHPIHTEAVTWIAGLPDVAFAFFYLLSFFLYMESREERSGGYMLSLACFAIAVLFKEPALTLPVILFAYDLTSGKAMTRPADYIKKYIPYIFIGAAYMALRINALGGFAPQRRHEALGPYQYAINVPPLFIQYLKKLVLPLDLNAFYVFHPILSVLQIKGAVSFILTIIFLIFLFIAFKKNKTAFLGLLLVIVPLLPALYIPALGENTFTERYLYLPSVGFVLLMAIFLSWVKDRLPHMAKSILTGLVVIAGLYAVGTVNRSDVWKDSFSLWSDTVRKSPDSAMAHSNLGMEYFSKGLFDMAIEQYRAALILKPDFVEVHHNLGNAYLSKGLFDMAVSEYYSALALRPNFAKAYYSLGLAYLNKGLFDAAIEQIGTALNLEPGYAEAHNDLGNAYQSKGSADMAIEQYQIALNIKPDYAEAHNNLGNAYQSKGLADMAIEQYRSAIFLKPSLAEAHNGLGNAYRSKGLFDMAVEQCRAALTLKPDYAEAHYNLGLIYMNNGATNNARMEFEAALKIKPDDYRTIQMLGSLVPR